MLGDGRFSFLYGQHSRGLVNHHIGLEIGQLIRLTLTDITEFFDFKGVHYTLGDGYFEGSPNHDIPQKITNK